MMIGQHLFGLFGVFVMVLSMDSLATSSRTEVSVKLLGQQCLLMGPGLYSKAALLAIHSIGPAQVNPNLSFPESIALQPEIQKQKDYLATIKGVLPSLPLLENYRVQLEKRLRAQLDLLSLVGQQSRKSAAGSAALEASLARIQQHLLGKNLQQWPKWSEKIQQWFKGKPDSTEFFTQLFNFYNEAITPDPQSDFYGALNRAGIEYACTLDR